MDNKYGFVYIWRDKGKDRYYIGCHWGQENDGYICSSNWMRMSHKRRPQDFRRHILFRCTNKEEMFEKEYQWLKLIKEKQLGKRYYNLATFHYKNRGKHHRKSEKTIQKIKEARANQPPPRPKGSTLSEEHKRKIGESNKGKQHSVEQNRNHSKIMTGIKHKKKRAYRKQSEEHIRKRIETTKLRRLNKYSSLTSKDQ